MWGEPPNGFSDFVQKFSPLIAILSPIATYFLGSAKRAHVNDAELIRVVEAVKKLGDTDSRLLEQAQINHNNITELTQAIKSVDQKVESVCRDTRDLRERIDGHERDLGRLEGKPGGRR